MSEGHTPTVASVRAAYVIREMDQAKARGRFEISDLDTYHAEFNRFIDSVRAGETRE